MINNKINIEKPDIYIGKVMKIDTTTRKVYCYFPRLMMSLSSNGIYNKPLPAKKQNINSLDRLNISDTITKSNILSVDALDKDAPMPEIGSLIAIIMIDNFEHRYWTKFNPNGDYKVIPEEMYEELYNINIDGNSIDITEQDNLNISIPDDFTVLCQKDDKNIIVDIKYNTDKGKTLDELREECEMLHDNMDYLIEEYRTSTNSSLSEILETIMASNDQEAYAVLKNTIASDIRNNYSAVSIRKLKDTLQQDTKMHSIVSEVIKNYKEFVEWLDTQNMNQTTYPHIPTRTEATTIAYKYICDNAFDLNTLNEAYEKYNDRVKKTKTIDFYYDGVFLGTNTVTILGNVRVNNDIPTNIKTQLSKYATFPQRVETATKISVIDNPDMYDMATNELLPLAIESSCNVFIAPIKVSAEIRDGKSYVDITGPTSLDTYTVVLSANPSLQPVKSVGHRTYTYTLPDVPAGQEVQLYSGNVTLSKQGFPVKTFTI